MSNYKFTTLAVAALVAVLAVSQTTLARQTFLGTNPSDSEPQTPPAEDGLKTTFYAPDSPIQSCLSSYLALPHSTTYIRSDWDMSFKQRSTSNVPMEQMIDLNGDGLVDYQYVNIYQVDQSSGNLFRYQSCVYLNTGSGFEQVHQCYADVVEKNTEIIAQDYYGDCAG